MCMHIHIHMHAYIYIYAHAYIYTHTAGIVLFLMDVADAMLQAVLSAHSGVHSLTQMRGRSGRLLCQVQC